MSKTIKRSKFVAAVEKGIRDAPGLTQAEKIALRSVAATAPHVAVGSFGSAPDATIQMCGCPLSQIGLHPNIPGMEVARFDSAKPDTNVYPFARAFDRAIPGTSGVYRVVED